MSYIHLTLGAQTMNPCIPRWDIKSAKKSTKAPWVQLEESLYESRCGRFRVQQVQTGPSVVMFLAFVNAPEVGWKHYGQEQPTLSAAVLLCNKAIEQGVFSQATNH